MSKLSKHFTLEEMTRTSVPLANVPPAEVVDCLRTLCVRVLEPIRQHYGRPVVVHSGYRSPEVNKEVGGSASSQHMKGEAVDFHVRGHSVYDVAVWISANLEYDQVILENFVPGISSSGWVHCSFARRNRENDLTKFRGSKIYYPGILLNP